MQQVPLCYFYTTFPIYDYKMKYTVKENKFSLTWGF